MATRIKPRLEGNFFTTSDLCSAYNQVPLTEKTKQLASFVIGLKRNTFERGFYGRQQAQDETEMFQIIDKYHELLRKSGLEAQP